MDGARRLRLRRISRSFGGVLAAALLLPAGLFSTPHPAGGGGSDPRRPPRPSKGSNLRVESRFGRLPLRFLENRGQVDGPASFYVKCGDRTFFFTEEGFTCVLHATGLEGRRRRAVRLAFAEGARKVQPAGLERAGGICSWFRGKPSEWIRAVPTWKRIVYREVWPGIDVTFIAGVNRIESEFHLAPGADPSRIRLVYRGITGWHITKDGSLEVECPLGTIREEAPRAYQGEGADRREVPVVFTPRGNAGRGSLAFGFTPGSWDRCRPLVIDPVYLVYSGFIGGDDDDICLGVAVDAEGCAYLTGYTSSDENSFPVKTGPDLTYNDDGYPSYSYDAFVAKVSADGTHFVYCGYIGGKSFDLANCIAVDAQGCAYVGGNTMSKETYGFPVNVGPDLTFNGKRDAFVAKVSADGTHLEYCGYVGGKSSEDIYGIAADDQGNAYVAGWTQSTQFSFPVKVGPDLTRSYGVDGFVGKLKADGTEFIYCGYVGGEGDHGESCTGITVDPEGCAYLCGYTSSSEDSFPVLLGPDLTYNGGKYDAFTAKVKADGTWFEYCGYIGGDAPDRAYDVALDKHGNLYVTGNTESLEDSFPVKQGPVLLHGGKEDAFVAKVDASGLFLHYCGYIGGKEKEEGYGIGVDDRGRAVVAGSTLSDESSFPLHGGLYQRYHGMMDGFVCQLTPSGADFRFSGYLGGSDVDWVKDLAVDASGSIYLCGYTDGKGFPSLVGPDIIFNGFDGFVTKIAVGPHPVREKKMRKP